MDVHTDYRENLEMHVDVFHLDELLYLNEQKM